MVKFRQILFVVMVVLLIASPASAEIKKMKLKWANFLPISYYWSEIDNYFADQLEKQTGGKVKIKVFHGGTLGKVGEMPKLVSSGAVDFGNFPASYFFSQFPMTTSIAIPLQTFSAPAATELSIKLSTHAIFKEENKRNNLHPFLHGGLAPYHLIARKPLRTLEDLKGLKVRSYGSLNPIVFKALGMVPVNIPGTEVYESLQRNSIDVAFYNNAGMRQWRLYEVAKYICDINFGSVGKYLTYVNLDVWNSFSKELQTIFNLS